MKALTVATSDRTSLRESKLVHVCLYVCVCVCAWKLSAMCVGDKPNAVPQAPRGKRSVVAKGGGYDHHINHQPCITTEKRRKTYKLRLPGLKLTAFCRILRTTLVASTRPPNSKFSSLSTARAFSASSSAPSTTLTLTPTPAPFLLPPPTLTFPSTSTGAFTGNPENTILLVTPTSRNAKEIICRQRFGVLAAPSARSASPGSRVGFFIIARPACWAARTASRAVPYFIQSATTGFIASIFPSRNRVSLKEAFEGPEPYDGKLSRPVLRGLAPSNGGWLLGDAILQ